MGRILTYHSRQREEGEGEWPGAIGSEEEAGGEAAGGHLKAGVRSESSVQGWRGPGRF